MSSKRLEQNFLNLFRNSQFAKFDPLIHRVYTSSPPPIGTVNGETIKERPQFFGFKRDMHPTHYGKPLKYVQMKSLDGNYGLSEVRDATDKERAYKVMSEIQRLMGKGSFMDFTGRPSLREDGLRIPGRVLNRLSSGGYAVGIGGIVAELPVSEIPAMQHFTNSDIINRRTFLFYVTKAEFEKDGTPKISLSLQRQS